MNSHFNPQSGKIVLIPGATLYARFHELAHAEQYESAKWRFWFSTRMVRGLSYLSTLWVEYDAHRRARRVMKRLGVWNADAAAEGNASLKSYITRKELT
jgi:hypothetical protein